MSNNIELETSQSSQSENFVIFTFDVLSKVEDEAQEYVATAGQRDKDIQKDWIKVNNKKRSEQLNLSQQSKYMSFALTALMVVSVAASVGGTAVSLTAGDSTSHLGTFLNTFSNISSNHGKSITEQVGAVYSQKTQAEITQHTDTADKLRMMDKQEQESRKQDLNSLKEKVNNGIRDGIDKAGNPYAVAARGA